MLWDTKIKLYGKNGALGHRNYNLLGFSLWICAGKTVKKAFMLCQKISSAIISPGNEHGTYVYAFSP